MNDGLGMGYENVRKRVRRITKAKPDSEAGKRLVDSLINQAERKDPGAGKELRKELRRDF